MSYLELLRHPKWQKKRLLILERDNFTCCYCSDKETELQIHHLKYHKNPWDAKDEYLLTLCKDCHGLVTAFKDFVNISVEKVVFPNGDVTFYVRHNYEDFIAISMIEKMDNNYNEIVRFKQNGISINKLMKLNNG